MHPMITSLLLALALAADIPPELQPLIDKNHEVLELASADLNRDGRADYLVALQPSAPAPEGEMDERPRPLLVVIRNANGALEVAARNERANERSESGLGRTS